MISTASSRAPRSSADSTPGTCSMAFLACRAIRSSVRSGTSPASATTSTGIERQVDLLHARLVGVLRQIALGLVDLGAHVGERDVGVEAGLELEQHVAAALEGGRAHFLDVADLLELGLDHLAAAAARNPPG